MHLICKFLLLFQHNKSCFIPHNTPLVIGSGHKNAETILLCCVLCLTQLKLKKGLLIKHFKLRNSPLPLGCFHYRLMNKHSPYSSHCKHLQLAVGRNVRVQVFKYQMRKKGLWNRMIPVSPFYMNKPVGGGGLISPPM